MSVVISTIESPIETWIPYQLLRLLVMSSELEQTQCRDMMICESKSEFVAEMMRVLRYEFQCHKHNHSAVTVKCVRL
jgi:hypothetical protein